MKFLLTIAFVFISIMGFPQNPPMDPTGATKTYIGKSFNKFSHTSIDGVAYSNDNLKGKITLINFWFAACPPCIAEFNDLNILHNNLKSNTNFQFISFAREPETAAKQTIEKYNLNFPVISLTKYECKQLSNFGFPLNVVIDENGKIVFMKLGGPLAAEAVKIEIGKLQAVIEKSLLAFTKGKGR